MRQLHRSAGPILFTLATLMAATSLYSTEKKLIEFGWDEPNTQFMREHIAEMEQTPFDGCVFDVAVPGGHKASLTGGSWGLQKLAEADVAPAIADLKATRFKKFTDCFLRFDVTPGNVDWFDDFSAVTANAALAAHVAHDGGVKGILFDVEPYAAQLFDYRKQRDANTKSFAAYAAQTRNRGQQLMTAFQSGYPNVTIFLTFGYTLPQLQMEANHTGLDRIQYGLLPALLDGMLDAARGKSRIIDGYEPSYGFKNKIDFDEAKKVRTRSLPLVTARNPYAQFYSFGFGLWMDMDWRKHGWNTKNFSQNYFTPQAFERSVRLALDASDEYVWIYTEKPKWWSTKGKQELPPEYEAAVRRERTK